MLSAGSALAGSLSPMVGAALPWFPETMAGPVMVALMVGALLFWFLIGVTSVWLTSKVLVSESVSSYGSAVAVWFFQMAAAFGLGIFQFILLLAFDPGNETGRALVALFVLLLVVASGIRITGRVYGIGALRAFCFNLLSGFFFVLICGVIAIAVLTVGGVGINSARAKLEAAAEQTRQSSPDILPLPAPLPPAAAPMLDLSPEIDGLLAAALHSPGALPSLTERETIVRQLQGMLQTQQDNLDRSDSHAVAAYQNRLNRYLLLLDTVKAERKAQTAREATAARQVAP